MKDVYTFIKNARWLSMAAAVVAGVFLVTLAANAATTITTNISTGGNLTVSGTASTTLFSATGISYFGGTATSTFSAAGVLSAVGNTSLVTASTTGAVSVAGALWVGGNATTTAAGAIATQSTLTVAGLSSLGQASTTVFSAHTAYFGATATSSFTSAGVLTLQNEETISNSTNGTITLGATNMVLVGTASTSAIKVGDEADVSTINGLIFGYCTAASVTVSATSSAMLSCTGATGVAATDRVFVQATSSLPDTFVIQAASSSAADTIQIRVFNMATSTPSASAATGINSFNFWAVRP